MKNFKISFLVSAISLVILCFTGCAGDPAVTAARVAGTQVNAVDAAMKGWADYVKTGHAKQSEVDAVHAAYDKYYKAAQVERIAFETYFAASQASTNVSAEKIDWRAASAAAIATQSELLDLINKLKGK